MIKRHKMLFIALFLYLLSMAAFLLVSLSLNQGQFVYALDDPYIHMSISKNLVCHGSWSANNVNFTSTSSAPLWTLIISAAYFIFGINVIVSFVLNVLFGLLVILLSYQILSYYDVTKYVLLILTAIIFAAPLPALSFTGMEHNAQIAAAILFVFMSSKLIVSEKIKSGFIIALAVITAVLTGLRYEGLFLVLSVCILLILNKKIKYAFIIALLGAFPILMYGIISKANGWSFLPNTILVKSRLPSFSAVEIIKYSLTSFHKILNPQLWVLLFGGSIVFILNSRKEKSAPTEKQVMLVILIMTIIIHSGFVHSSHFYRYEAYIIVLGILSIYIGLIDCLPADFTLKIDKSNMLSSGLKIFLILIITMPLVLRALLALTAPRASNNIYEQQYQMSLFVRDYTPGMNIAANDIGLIGFYSNNEILDLWGLACNEVAKERINKTYSTKKIYEITKQKNIKLALVYDNWYTEFGGLPPSWTKLAQWTIPEFWAVCGPTVTFYAVDKNETENLRKKLEEFSPKLPKSVKYTIFN